MPQKKEVGMGFSSYFAGFASQIRHFQTSINMDELLATSQSLRAFLLRCAAPSALLTIRQSCHRSAVLVPTPALLKTSAAARRSC